MIHFVLEVQINKEIDDLKAHFITSPSETYRFSGGNVDLVCWGDPIVCNNFAAIFLRKPDPDTVLNNIYGHYYFILSDKTTKRIITGTSFFSVLPLYYTLVDGKLVFSENAIRLGTYLKQKTVSKRFILEFILFNYPLFNHAIYEEIKLVPSNSFIAVTEDKWYVVKHTSIENFIVSTPEPWRRSVGAITEVFLDSARKYLPESEYLSSLTGGFDSRTLLAVGLYYNKKLSCFSFGTSNSKDIQIASSVSESVGVPFTLINLDDRYIEEQSYKCGREFIWNSSGNASFARAHYLHAARKLAGFSEIIITGNFGSEVFRAVRNPGVVFSKNLIDIFSSSDYRKTVSDLKASNEFGMLRKEVFRHEWEEMIEEISTLPSYNQAYRSMTPNQRFYVFVFEETFRKYFGAEIINQFYYLKNRTPFLDIDFLKAILKTGLAGVYSDFFEHNPIKRYKGHVLYSNIIRKAYPQLGKELTDKGHRPADLFNFYGKVNILRGYISKRIRSSPYSTDPNAVRTCFDFNRDHFRDIDPGFFNQGWITDRYTFHEDNEAGFRILSISSLIKEIRQ